jgi:hypothetical protein
MGLFVQPHKCSAWALSGLPPGFIPLIEFCYHFNGIRILGVPFGFISFAFFLQGALSEDVRHVDMFLILGGHPCGVWYPFKMFHP